MAKVLIVLLLSYLFSYSNLNAQSFIVDLFSEGFSSPLDIQSAGDDRIFIVEKNGVVKIINSDGTVRSEPFIDLTDNIDPAGEGGLLGLAFHPEYNINGYFFVSYVDLNRDTQISRFNVSANNDNIADPNSELPILNFERNTVFHYGGALAFGPDNYLYIASGDDLTFVDSQDTASFLGKILRIDIDNPSGGNNYGIPADNPFVGSSSDLEEIWALGLRNPWKFSFDFVENTIWIADVGESSIEEINSVSILEGGLNFGWPCYEGSLKRKGQDCPPSNKLEFPIAEYSHDIGSAIIGGYVYRGALFPDYYGTYLFADIGSKMIGWLDTNDDLNYTFNYEKNWSSFGVDNKNEVYLAAFTSGEIYKLQLILNDEGTVNLKPILYPNPSKNEVFIESQNNILKHVKLFDMFGKTLIFRKNINHRKTRIETHNLTSGIYILEIETIQGNIGRKKLLVKK